MLVDIKVIPKSSRNMIKVEAGRLKVYLTVAPEKGKANQALVELVAEYYKVKKHQVRIVKGAHSALKVVSVEK
ncbi:MAG: DUF167 domain-containing protein [Candidatus Omnitrophica bacterium]|nr:DUF167 domain-containing protein [Candidatus Omnitrophota bacterium]